MLRFIPYIFPILVNYVLGGMFFITSLRCSLASAPGWVVGATTSTWALIYSIVSFLMSSRVTAGNAAKLIITGGLLITLSSLGFLLFSGVYTQFVWIFIAGAAGAIYCTSFQIFAKAIEKDQNAGVSRASGLYTASWSIGMATGPFIFGVLPVEASFMINAVIGLMIAAGIFLISRKVELQDNAVRSAADSKPVVQQPSKPDMVLAGWLIGGAGTITVFILRTMLPYRATLLDFSRADAGSVLAIVSYTQAAAALLLMLSKDFMYRIIPVIAAGISGVTALLILGFSNSLTAFILAAVLYGCYSGYVYFMFVYHSLISPSKSTRYVAINEMIVGITGTVGPFAGGLMSSPQNSGTAFLAAACICTASVAATVIYFAKNGQKL